MSFPELLLRLRAAFPERNIPSDIEVFLDLTNMDTEEAADEDLYKYFFIFNGNNRKALRTTASKVMDSIDEIWVCTFVYFHLLLLSLFAIPALQEVIARSDCKG